MRHEEIYRRVSNLLSIPMLLVLASLGCGRSSSSIGVSHGPGKQGVLVEDQVLDLGPVLESQNTVKSLFHIVNSTKSSIKIKKVAPSCACSDAHLDKNELAPGEEATLQFESNVKGRGGKQRFVCRIDPEQGPSFFCSALATVYRPFEFEESNVLVGSLEHSTPCSFTKKLYVNTTPAEKERYQIASLAPPRGVIDASLVLREERVIGNGILQKVYDVSVTLLPNATSLPGKRSGSLILSYTDQKGPGGAVVMEVTWTTPEHLQISPSRVAFGSIPDANSNMEKDVILECSTPAEPRFRIIKTLSSHPCLSVLSIKEVPGADGRRYRIRIALDTLKIDRFFSESITFFTDQPLAPTIRLPVIAYKGRTPK